jgi:hypothetical protein
MLGYARNETPAKRLRELTSLTVGGRSGILGRRDFGGLVHNGGRGGVDRYMIGAWNQRGQSSRGTITHSCPISRQEAIHKMVEAWRSPISNGELLTRVEV